MPIVPLAIHSQTEGIESGTFTDILRIQSVDPTFRRFYRPESNPLLYKILALMRKGAPVHDPMHTWFEEDKIPSYTTVKVDCTEGDGTGKTLIITSNVAVANTILFDEATGEQIRTESVESIDTATEIDLKVYRGWNNTDATVGTLAAGTRLRVGPTILPEGGDPNNSVTFQPDSAYNYATFFSERVGITDVQQNSKTLNGVHTLSDQEEKTVLRVMEQMDAQLRHGTRGEIGTANTIGTIYMSDGFEARANYSIALEGAELDWSYLDSEIGGMWDTYTGHSPQKIALLGPTLFDQINRATWDAHNPVVPHQILGTMVKKISFGSGGELLLIRDNWGFEGVPTKGYIIDPAYASLHEFAGMELQRHDVTATDKPHVKYREIYGSMLPVFACPKFHGVITWTNNA